MLKTSINYINAMGNRYKEIVYEKVEYDGPKVTLKRIKALGEERDNLITRISSEL